MLPSTVRIFASTSPSMSEMGKGRCCWALNSATSVFCENFHTHAGHRRNGLFPPWVDNSTIGPISSYRPTAALEDAQMNSTLLYTADLAQQVSELWTSIDSDGEPPPRLPPLGTLMAILEAAYLSSLENEEGRGLEYTLYCIPRGRDLSSYYPKKTFDVVKFEESRLLSVKELRRLAPAAHPAVTGIVIEWFRTQTYINGIVHLGTSWSVTRKGLSYDLERPPHALQIEVLGRGELAVSRGQFAVASLRGGTVIPSYSDSTDRTQLTDISSIIKSGMKAMSALPSLRSKLDEDAEAFELIAYTNVLYSILNGIEARRHGGALILCDPRYVEECGARVKKKYSVTRSNLLQKAFLRFISARHDYRGEVESDADAERSGARYRELKGIAAEAQSAQRELNSATSLIAGLSNVDGAVFLGADFSCHGFGCEILAAETLLTHVYSVESESGNHKRFSSEDFGMRHRSAFRFCGTSSRVAVFVCSQDGGINLVYRKSSKIFKRLIFPINSII